ncbi:hypothetical protein VNO78_22116 [Psophocarpus tetragonolobus]|uniref:CUE domain-containing protein n=1 Tax=Psophocarpus tetragonolobus TaxID=3891 RepID=A0AAN9SGF1_PSOTE
MGFNSVYRSLQEIFPQVDARLLRAVAIEHPKDADLAAAIVLTEVIPFMSKKLPPATPLRDNDNGAPQNVEVESEEEGNSLRHHQLVDDVDMRPSSSGPLSRSVEVTETADHSFVPDLNKPLDKSSLSKVSNSNDGTDKFLGVDDIKELDIFLNAQDNFNGETSVEIAQETLNGFSREENFEQRRPEVDVDSENLISSSICQHMEHQHNNLSKEASSTNGIGHRIGNCSNEEWVDFVGPSADDYDTTTSHRSEECETYLIEVESSEAQAVCHVQGNTLNSKDGLLSELDASGNTSDVKDNIGMMHEVSQYSQVCSIDLLEEIIDEAKTNKKTLFSSMESLINLMREVELQEKAAELANMEVATGGSNILARIEEYKAMLVQAKEANDMHAGEVYGEKAILATEMKELQSRLLSLSDERDKSLAILDEMHHILEARLTAAEELRKAAEQEKLEKEESARKALVEQETLVEMVVHESQRLQLEAEENSKLREFLMDRGQVVDMLQGEISVICQDIKLLKEKFDANLPLSKSFNSTQTSCKLASSGSSHKSIGSDVGSEHSDTSEMGKTSRVASIESLASKCGHDEEKPKVDHNALLDDEWDIFEKDVELNSGIN